MLKNIDPLLTPDLLWILAAMGHGDELALVDAHHPGERIARATATGRLVRPGVTMERAAAAILSLLPLDDFVETPLRRMEVVGRPDEIPPVQRAVAAAADAALGPRSRMGSLERFAFYAAAKEAFAVVQVGDARPYGCFLIRKGVLKDEQRTGRP